MPTTPIDPVCGMPVDDLLHAPRATRGDRSYVFCSAICRDRFTAEPDSFTRADLGARG